MVREAFYERTRHYCGVAEADGCGAAAGSGRSRGVSPAAGAGGKTLGEALLEFAGVAEGLPADMAENHDHYLHARP